MELKKIEISNYRSIESLVFEVDSIAKTFAYTFLGINEAGKSSLLKAMDLINTPKISFPLDYHDKEKDVEVIYVYTMTNLEKVLFIKHFCEKLQCKLGEKDGIIPNEIKVSVKFAALTGLQEASVDFRFSDMKNTEYGFDKQTNSIKSAKSDTQSGLVEIDLEQIFEDNFIDYFDKLEYKISFWQSTPEFLISDSISLANFHKIQKVHLNHF